MQPTQELAMSRLDPVSPFLVMDVVRRARALPDAIHFEVGEPDFPLAPAVLEAIRHNAGQMGYTESLGLPALRQRIAE
jgi:aspartate/methionine/tyrosine aminotransferase